MTFEWDEDKNRINIGKHGVSFETATRIFEGPVLAVIHTDRSGKTRIISARPADRTERNRYEEAIQKRTGH